ncbi:MAG: reductase [Lactobacillaceae bacterium]|jgi:riboflavin biosynthesis RibT protein|nr:reductase [Lactobacillaceae bacterium]
MLIVVQDEQPKIAMGLMSYIPKLNNLAAVKREIDWYHADKSRDLLLWREPDTMHYVAVLGVEKVYDSVLLRMLAFGTEVNPENKAQVGKAIYQGLLSRYPDKFIMGTIATQEIINEWYALNHE